MILPAAPCHFQNIISLKDHWLKFASLLTPALGHVRHWQPKLNHEKYQYRHPICHLRRTPSMELCLCTIWHITHQILLKLPRATPRLSLISRLSCLSSRERLLGAGPSSPSTASSDGSLEEFLRLPVLQSNIPIDPEILADVRPWETSNLHQPVRRGDSFAIPKATCPYPEPPLSMFCDAPYYHQGSEERFSSWNGNAQMEDGLHIQDHQQLYPSQHRTEADVPCSSGVDEDSGGEPFKSLKRGAQELEERAMKRPRLASASLAGEDSFTALRSHFLSLRLDERLQFLSWLFEGALASCTPDSNKSMRPAISDSRKEIEQTWHDHSKRRKAHGDKMWRWSPEDDARLLSMTQDRRPWPEIERCFLERTESALRQRQSTLRRNRRGVRSAEPTPITPVSAAVI
ncbi:hypothetical protein GX48_03347 [Paracoccidioides brasiliensis]|nr:hypothetical protein GX48_03347 [Paracoccidioides brasiliensis]